MKRALVALLLPAAPLVLAQEDDAVVVTATRGPQPALEIPASVDRVFGPEIREGRPQVNLSESLGRVPGIVVQNRSNYAQDLQVSSRGFGARAQFGVRGIRLIADGIPATMPDGQGQPATFSLGSAQSIEVLRGPFSALYGNAAGGVIVVETEDAPADALAGTAMAQAKKDDPLLKRGKYVVTIGGCNDCHTPGYGPTGGKVPEPQWLTGDALGFNGPWGTTYPTNLRLLFQDMTEEQWIKRAKTVPMRPPMPWFNLRDMSTTDLRAMYRYIRSLGPAGKPAPAYLPPDRTPPEPVVRFPAPPPGQR